MDHLVAAAPPLQPFNQQPMTVIKPPELKCDATTPAPIKASPEPTIAMTEESFPEPITITSSLDATTAFFRGFIQGIKSATMLQKQTATTDNADRDVLIQL